MVPYKINRCIHCFITWTYNGGVYLIKFILCLSDTLNALIKVIIVNMLTTITVNKSIISACCGYGYHVSIYKPQTKQ